jgi:hypothetical protein
MSAAKTGFRIAPKRTLFNLADAIQHQFSFHGVDVFCLATRNKYHEKYH